VRAPGAEGDKDAGAPSPSTARALCTCLCPPPVTVDAFFSILTSFVAALRRAQAENADEEARRAQGELRRQAGSIRGGGGALATPLRRCGRDAPTPHAGARGGL